MMLLQNLLLGFGELMHFGPLMALVVGVIVGIIIGVLPGLSASTGVALLVPFTWFLDPVTAVILLGAIYTAGEYGGSITAITINTPGTSAAVATTFDGYPLTRKGRMGDALTTSIVASTVGGLVGTLALILFAPTLAEVALQFGPAEYVALGVMGLTLAASLSSGDFLKGAISTVLGLLLATAGQDHVTGAYRFTFGFSEMIEGIGLIPALIGLFAASEVFGEFIASSTISETVKPVSAVRLRLRSILWEVRRALPLGSILGTVIGIFPGAGATIASLISYNEARRFSRTPEEFGKGTLEGVAAAESANNASVGGALIPLLTLGIPGSGTTAILLGALLMHGLQPGPELFRNAPNLVYGLFVALIFANIVMLILGLAGVRFWLFVMRTPKPYLMTIVMSLCVLGSFGVNNSIWDVGQMVAFGFLGFLLKRFNFPVATVVLGLVLGSMIETNLSRSILLGGWGIFLQRPIAVILLLISVGSMVGAGYKQLRTVRLKSTRGQGA